MSKMNEMAQTIEELRTAAAAISDIADWLTAQFGGTDDKQQSNNTAAETPKPKAKLTLEQVRATLAEKSRAGHTAEIRALLQKYGAAKLSQIDPANYEALLRDAEVLDNAT
ncbi:MAG: DNA ligase [Clostridiales bacterium]|nr:DNA ligase [Clostridiales bacterium]